MIKKKSFISLVLAFCLIIPAMFMLTACGGNNTQTLKSDDGIAVVGEFEKGAELKTDKVEVSSTDADTIFGKLESGNIVIISKDNAMIYDIFVSKDNKKVQPNGKVAVSVPVTESATGYKVFHIKDNNTIEELSATYKDGILTFETESFSYFVIVPTGDVSMNTNTSDPTPDTGDDTPTAGSEAEWDNAINYWKDASNVKVVEKTVTPQSYDEYYGNMGARFTIHEYNGTVISILTYAENVAKGSKPSIILENNNETYSHYETSDNGATWNKDTSSSVKGEYEDVLACRVYGWREPGLDYGLSTPVVDFSYSNFEYDETKGAYTSKDGKEITVEFKFENNSLTEIVITKGNATNDQTTRTITFGNAVVTIPTVAGSQAKWDSAINYWKAQTNVRVLEDHSNSNDQWSDLYQFDGTTISVEEEYNGDEKSKYGRYFMSDGVYIDYQDPTGWVKQGGFITQFNAVKDSHNGWNLGSDGSGNDVMADFTYANFTYDATTKSYKNSVQNIEVSFEFSNNVLTKIQIKHYDSISEISTTRTITFTGIEINVPTDFAIDDTISK